MKDIVFAIVRRVTLLVALLGLAGQAGATNYIFKSGDYYLGVSGGSIAKKETFDLTCIWTAADGNGNEKSLGGESDKSSLYAVEGTTRYYLHDSGRYNLTLQTSGSDNKRFWYSSNLLRFSNVIGTDFYVTLYDGDWAVYRGSDYGTHPSITTESGRTSVQGGTTYTITGPTVSPTSWTATALGASQAFTPTASATKSDSPAYNKITLGGSTYYIRTDNQVRSTTVPVTSSSTIDISYTWNNEHLPAGSTMTTSGNQATVTYSTAQTDTDKTGMVTLRATAVDGSTTTSTYKDAEVSVTIKKIPVFYYTASTTVSVADVGTVSVTPTSGNVTGTSASQTSASVSLTYKASVNSGKKNLYEFAGWSTDGTTKGIISGSNVASFTYTATINSTNSASPTAVKLTAMFTPLSRLKVITTSDMGYVYSVGDSKYTGGPSSVTEDVTTRDDGKSHTMYMYAWPKTQTVGGVTTDQYKFKGWSSTNSHSNYDGGTNAIDQTITVGSPEYKEMYAMFKRYFKFKVEGVSLSNGTVSTDGGTVVATFDGKSPAGTSSTDTWETEIETGTTSTVTTSFKATANGSYQFKGWYSDEALTTFVNGANPYKPELTNSASGTTATMKLYAKFTLEAPPTSISIGSDFELQAGGTKDLTVTYTPNNNATYKYTKLSSSSTSIATVSKSLVEGTDYGFTVTGVAPGQATITATAYQPDNTTPACSTQVVVTVKAKLPAPVITVTPDPDDLNRALVEITPGTGSPSTLAIYYTTNGQDPTTASTLYTDPFYIPNLTTVKAIATSTAIGWMNSDIVQQGYSKQKTKRPIIDIDGNEVTFLSASEPDVTYYYTTDGSEPTTGHGTTWTTADDPITNITSGSTIKVIATKADLGPSDVASALFTRLKVPTPEIQVAGNRVWFLDSETGVTYYYTTDGTTPTTSSTSNDGSEIEVSGAATIKVIAVKSGYLNSDPAEKKKNAANVVYLDFSKSSSGDGKTPETAVNSWANAYALLGFGPNAKYLRANWAKNGLTTLSGHTCFNGTTDESFTNTVDNNIIYLVGDVSEGNFTDLMEVTGTASSETNLMSGVLSSGFFKPATISGKYATKGSASDGRPIVGLSASDNHILNEDTRFEYIEFQGSSSGTSEAQFVLAYYDLEMGKCITNKRFFATKDFNQTYHHGFAKGVTNTAHILFYGGHVNDSRFRDGTKEMQFDDYLPHPEGYKITIRSGFFSTISPGGKQWNSNINGVMGSPNTPVKCTITVDIDRAWNDAHQSGVLRGTSASDPITCDVAVLIAGTHEGSMYGDVDIIVKSGKIDRVVNGSFGAHNQITGYPCDSYFGRANILIDPREPSADEKTAGYSDKNKLVEIRELYGGGLGRYKGTSSSNEAATNFYGKSTVIINGGTFSSAIYASGAGGCNGIGDDTHHTVDQYLPYGGNTSAPTYGNYAAWKAGTKTVVKCLDTDGVRRDIDLAKTSTKIEIHGGVFGSSSAPIDGIFGGGYGYVDKELIADGVTPHTQAGSILAAAGDLASSVLIDGKTEIYGNVYAAGRGTKYYYDYGRTAYTALALISGNTQLTIGGKVKVHGGVYGAGQGISTLANMARLYGNTTIKIQDRAEVSDGVYGGGQDGSMDGNVTLSLLGDCKIGTSTTAANVHGGGYGSTTNVNGNVRLNIGESTSDEPVVFGDVYGGSALGTVNASAKDSTVVTMKSGTVNGSIYGGGLGDGSTAANVNGNVQVNVYEGTVSKTTELGSGGVYGCNNVNGTPKGTVKVDIYGTDPAPSATGYALYSVYGGGNQSAYTGTPVVTIHDCDNSIEYVYGGGNAAAVAGTDVRIYGGDVIGNVFGGGNGSSEGWPSGTENPGANVTTSGTKVNIYGGTILSVFGGSNTKGLITGGTSVIVNAKQEKGAAYACKVKVDNVFGAGNKAPYTGNTDVQIINTSAGGLDGSVGNVFGGGNLAQMTGNSSVKVGAKNPDDTTYKVNITGNVFGGGNEANTNGSTNLSVENCATTIAGDVYGGANLADVTNSNVNIYGGTIDNVFGGGRGSSTTGADVTGSAGDGNATTYIYGGKFGGIYGAGNIKSDITGVAFLRVDEKTSAEHACCDFEGADEIYGAGNQAAISGSIDFGLGCIPGKIEELYGGAKNADLGSATKASNVTLSITSGQFGKVFGGNNLGGTIYGTVTVNVQHSGCDVIEIDELYGGGNLADYSAPTGNTDFPVVNLLTCDQKDNQGNPAIDWVNDGTLAHHCLKVGKIFGGGKGVNAPGDNRGKVTGNPHVNVYAGEVGTIYGGGNAADVVGETYVTVLDQAAGDNQDIYITGNIYGGGNEAAVTGGTGKGNTHVQIGPK